MKFLVSSIIALAIIGICVAQAGNLKSIRTPIDMTYGASQRFAVVFNHSTHTTVKCRTCHHIKTDDGKRFVNCTIPGCHSQPGAQRRDPLSMFMAYHAKGTDTSCYGCHKMEAASYPQFKGCQPCHVGPLTREQEQNVAQGKINKTSAAK